MLRFGIFHAYLLLPNAAINTRKNNCYAAEGAGYVK